MATIWDMLPESLKGRSDVKTAFDKVLSWLPEDARNSPTVQQMFVELLTPDAAQSHAAKVARDAETQRQADSGAARGTISQYFDSLGPQMATQARQSYLAANMPGVEQGYDSGRKEAIYAAARGMGGGLQSSATASKLSDLFQTYNEQRAKVQSGAEQAGQQTQASIDALRSGANRAVSAAFDPFAQARTGIANLTAYTAPQRFSPQAAMFQDVLTQAGNAQAAKAQGYNNAFASFFPGATM